MQWYAVCQDLSNPMMMIKNYLLLFVRNLRRQKIFSTINLLGLTVSIAATLILTLYVRHEFSYDDFHRHSERLYRVNQTFIWAEDSESQFSRTGPGVANALKEELPEVELVTSLHTPGNFIVSYVTPSNEIVAFEENQIFAADTNFFKVLNFPLIDGNESTAFSQANTLVMTESTAKKYFGENKAVGKMVRLGGTNGEQQTFEVTGVVADPPTNNTIEFDILLSMKGFPVERRHSSWIWTQLETFVLLRENVNIDHVRQKLSGIPRKRADESLREVMNMSYDEYIASGKKWELFLQPINTLHLPEHSVIGSFPDTGNVKVIYAFIGAAIFIVLLSCINFMNLSTAQFSRRIKEASVRKILGLGKKELGVSYFLEALVFCSLALILALGLAQLLLPAFNAIAGKQLSFSIIQDWEVILGLLALVLFMAVLSSSYPALFLTSFNPVNALKGKTKVGREGKSFRNALVVFQFCVSIMLIICTAVIFQQLKYASEMDLGFDRENLLVLHHAEVLGNGESLVHEALSIPGATKASWASSVPPNLFGGDSFTAEGSDLKFPLNYTSTDENFVQTMGIKLLVGRTFQEGNAADSTRIILNESAVRRIGWTVDESVIGKKIRYPQAGTPNSVSSISFEVIGVVADFNYWTIATTIEPMAIFHKDNKYVADSKKRFVVLRMMPQNGDEWATSFASLQTLWKKHAPETPFEYTFVDQSFAQTFDTQKRFGNVLTSMAFIAILIAGLGLLGMIIYSLEQRTKEIGIRKVSGASTFNILVLISRGYTKLILVAFLIGAPVSWWMMNLWLQDFAYAIAPSIWIFVLTGAGTLLLAILITGYHSVKAAMMNPVDVLKDE